MAMHNAFHSRNDINKFYLWREKGGKRSEDRVDLAIKRLTDYARKSKDKDIHDRNYKKYQSKYWNGKPGSQK